ncbi:TPA: hypothetical protein I8190_002097 [Citrobacter freundii]|uniref:hypothetical protein n=1 Tax=Citrobacter farmeri TaxID=67824 RepID=UPI001A18158B|nr:hypothetical protein [Citrobacter farmeri]HAT2285363.1 hypothetical protein [Citrobacter freundii]ELR9636253.1 hypothetical protein [Citrobacter farmeri]MEC3930898.1 hypothetical protein [Citrobacter farmeri]HAT2349357.1 hypothetical protein [Citrobacter freundii]HAT2431426.1 hypothetical protein [Citrobacter freundii]
MADYDGLVEAFRAGDIVFGLDKPRADALVRLRERYGEFDRIELPSTFFLCCFRKRHYLDSMKIYIQNDITNAVWDINDPLHYSSDDTIRRSRPIETDRVLGFRELLQHHDKYNVVTQTQGSLTLVDYYKRTWKRTSKAGLEYQLIHNNGVVHFIIDDLNFEDIARKERHGSKGNITSSEMRWLYRNRGNLNVSRNLRFWGKDREYTQTDIFTRLASYHPK